MTGSIENPKDDSSVRVGLRVRPQSAAEKIDMCRVCTSVMEDSPQIVLGKDKAFTYDYVFDQGSHQEDIYGTVASELIEGCFDGYNATILAYGQTGSGKTYTMGTAFDVSNSLGAEQVGIIPRAIKHIFDGISKRKQLAIEENRSPPEFKIHAQFMELYNEEIIDLLDIENKGKKMIKIHEDLNGNIYTTGVTLRNATSEKDIMKLLEEGALSRTTASTNMNATSSRSHAIFTVHLKHHRMVKIEGEENEEGNEDNQGEEFETLTAKFNFVDLAGSERLKRTGATGDRAKEGISINQGLLSLGNVISALGDKAKRGCHVPYRDSKLTRLLQDSLGGNSRTVMIACVSPSDRDFMETLNTLKYANRARNIKNKVVVNQDKASKQIAALRAEIQTLQVELLEYKQGKRVADGEGGGSMSDMFHENTLLNTENENLRLRIKALQETINAQTQQITELKAASVLANIGNGESDVEALIVGYVKEIEELSNKLLQSEAMSSAAVKRARAISRVALSPGAPEDETVSLIELAKLDLRKEKKRIKKEKHKHHPLSPIKDAEPWNNETRDEDKDIDEAEKEQEKKMKKTGVEEDIVDEEEEENDIDEEIDEEENDDADDVENDNELSDSDDDDDDAISLADSSIHEEALREDIADLSSEITIKQKLVEELEHSQKRLTALKHQYEEKLSLLQYKIKETEDERDKALKNIGTVDSKAEQKAKDIRVRYEKKLNTMQKELAKLQSAKREHARLIKSKEQNEHQLKTLRNELSDLKRMKVKLMRQMRDEMSKAKQREGKFSSQLEQMIKESRKKDIQLKTLKQESKQKDLVLKRKNEELQSVRRQIKPISGNVGMRKKQEEENAKTRAQFNQNGPYSSDEPRKRSAALMKSPSRDPNQKPPVGSQKSPAVSRHAKKKWEMLERKMNDLMLKMKTVANMENDMERWLQDRDRVSKQLEGCQKKKDEAVKLKRDDSVIQDYSEQLEALTAQMDYIQENISESQSTIMEMEDIGDMINSNEIIRGCSLSEARYMLEHFYGKSVELGQELANKDAAYKELELRLEAMEQHCEVQQQLLQHVFLEQHSSEVGGDDEHRSNADDGTVSESSLNMQPQFRRVSNKARRRTGCPEDFLKPALRLQSGATNEKAGNEPTKEQPGSFDKQARKGSDTPEVNQALMQKLMEIDRALKLKDKDKKGFDAILMPPPAMTRGLPSSSQATSSESRSRSLLQSATDPKSKPLNNNTEQPRTVRSASFGSTGSLQETGNTANETLPPSFQRGNRVSKSARTYVTKNSGVNHNLKQPVSASNSPTQLRKTQSDAEKGSRPNSLFPSSGNRGNNRGEPANDVNKISRTQKVNARNSPNKAETNSSDKTTPRGEGDSADVFTRLTSNLPQEADPDLGQMLPVKAPIGRPDSLMCTHTATGHNNAVLSLAVTEDLLITGSKDRTAKIWDLNRGDEILSLGGHKRDVTVVRYSPVTKLVFTVNQSTIKIWDIRQNTGTCVKTLSGNFFQLGESSIMDLGLNSAGTVLYSALGNTVKMVDLKTYGTIGKLSGHTGAVTCLLITPGERRGDICVTGSKDHYIKVFEVLEDVTGSQAVRITKINKHGNDKNLSALMPRHNLEPPHYDGVQSLAILNHTLFSGSRDNSIKKWNLNNHQLKHHITTAHKDWVCSLNIMPNHDVLLSGCRSGVLKTWHSGSCTQLGEINAHSRSINAISTNSSLLFTASSDRLVRIWKPTSTLDEQVRGVKDNGTSS